MSSGTRCLSWNAKTGTPKISHQRALSHKPYLLGNVAKRVEPSCLLTPWQRKNQRLRHHFWVESLVEMPFSGSWSAKCRGRHRVCNLRQNIWNDDCHHSCQQWKLPFNQHIARLNQFWFLKIALSRFYIWKMGYSACFIVFWIKSTLLSCVFPLMTLKFSLWKIA